MTPISRVVALLGFAGLLFLLMIPIVIVAPIVLDRRVPKVGRCMAVAVIFTMLLVGLVVVESTL